MRFVVWLVCLQTLIYGSIQPGSAAAGSSFDINSQAQALLPAFQSDLNHADNWNRYTINAAIDLQARTLTGHERLEYKNHDTVTLDTIYFHLYPNLPDLAGTLNVDTVTVDGQAVQTVYERGKYLLRVNLPTPLAPGSQAIIEFNFATQAPRNASARFYGAFNQEQGVLALASSYPIAAIVDHGVWDIAPINTQGDLVNSETALYDVTLTLPVDWSLVTSGVAIDQQTHGDQQITRIVSGPQRDFMISVTQFPHVSAEVAGTRINSYYRPGNENGGKVALQTAVNALRAFNVRYGRYPLVEFDIVEFAATTFLGVEYPGIVLIERSLYNRPQTLEDVVAHEVSHQWWYSIVGDDVQTESWIDEGMASFSEVVYQEEVHGLAAAERQLDTFRQRYRATVRTGRDAPLEPPTARFRRNYYTLAYSKSALFFQALRKQIGAQAFDRFLHDFYEQQRYTVATGHDLLARAEGACACDLDRLYSDWVL